MSNTKTETVQPTAHAQGYRIQDPAPFVHPDTPAAREELQTVGALAERYVRATVVLAETVPAPGAEMSDEHAEARTELATVRAALREAADVSPRALHALSRIVREYPAPGAQLARAESALRVDLEETANAVELEDGSTYRTRSNPNPDGLTVEDVDTHGTHMGYDPAPAVNVKVHADFSRVDWDDVRADLGLDAETLAPTGREDEDGELEVLPFGEEWIEARWDLYGASTHEYTHDGPDRSQSFYEGPESWAREHAWECGTERAAELLAPFGSPDLVSAGRSGGWACVKGLTDYEDLAETVASYEDDAERVRRLEQRAADLRGTSDPDDVDAHADELETVETELDALREELEEGGYHGTPDEARTELDRFLGAWGEFAEYCASEVRDIPRAVAWHCGANVFESEAAEYAEELERVARVRDLVRLRVPMLSGLAVLEDADPEELETMLQRADNDPLAVLGSRVLAELRERGMSKPAERDADGFRVRTRLGDGLARDGFHALHDAAEELGLLGD